MNIHDDILGELVFDYGWVKPVYFHFMQQEIMLNCVFSASRCENVSSKQQQAYALFQKQKAYFEQRTQVLLREYLIANDIESPKCIPTKILFQRDGSFGLLLDCNWDEEHGVVIVLNPTEKVGMQDIFL